MFVGKDRSHALEWSTRKELLLAYPKTLDEAGKACQGQNTLAYYENP
jgi:hypothetical protein